MSTSNTTGLADSADEEKRMPLVVGIGASAGGVEALRTFFEKVKGNSGIAYVVILHLSPDHDSQLTEILQNATTLPVIKLTERTNVLPDHVYVMSPNHHVTMVDGSIEVSPNISVEERRAPVDIFFRTLAEHYTDHAVAVVLSGTGANGSMGLKRVKEKGGAVFVQNTREASFSEMPRNSIATDLVDDILNVADMPARIIAYRDSLGTVEISVKPENRSEEDQQALRDIFTQLRTRTGHDFSNYKRATILRRIGRRISVRELSSLKAYAEYMRATPEEVHALLKDLLISVTNFFRDKASFEILENEIIPLLLEGKTSAHSIRIWVAACATGEEAYSLAMLLAERTYAMVDAPAVQLFATDIDENAIAIAREGFYTLNDAADVPPERLRNFFNTEAGGFRVRRDIREMILFANHNILKDPPFSRVDLVTCRNMLIYFNTTAQERVMETVHFALKPGGYFFLGGSETVTGATDLFMQVSKKANVYQSRPLATRMAYPVPNIPPPLRTAPEKDRTAASSFETSEPSTQKRMTFGDLHQKLLESYAPPSLVINSDYDIVHLSDKAGRYLKVSGGEITQNLLKLIPPEMRLEVRTALYQAVNQQINIRVKSLQVNTGNGIENIDVHIRPVTTEENGAKGFILVIFETVTGNDDNLKEVAYDATEPVAHHLESELITAKTQLRNASEQFEVQSEELKASNEELQAMNEELRSAAEEVETSKEELQSINEELVTVNQELKVKIDELSITNNNFKNLVNSTDIPTLFLDRHFHVSVFTPAAAEIFNLIPHDIGRPISDITSRFSYKDLIKDAESVLRKLNTTEREITTTDGKTYLLRISPYRTAEDRISGVVIVFINISDRIKAESELRLSEERFRAITLARTNTTIYRMSADWKEMYAPAGLGNLAEIETPVENWMEKYIPEEDREFVKTAIEEAIRTKSTFDLEHKIYRADGTVGYIASRAIPILGNEGNITEWFGIATDISGQKSAEVSLRLSEERKSYLLMITDAVQSKFNPGEIIEATTGIALDYFNADRCFYYEMKSNSAFVWQDAYSNGLLSVSGTYSLDDLSLITAILHSGEVFIIPNVQASSLIDDRAKTLCLDESIESFMNVPVVKNGDLVGCLCIARRRPGSFTEFEIDLGEETAERTWSAVERVKTGQALRESEERMRLATTAACIYFWEFDIITGAYTFSSNAAEILGVSTLPATIEDTYKLVHPDDRHILDEQMEIALREKKGFEVDFRSIKDNGRIVWLSVQTDLIKDAAGNPVRIVGIAQDITKRKEAEEALSYSETRLRIVAKALGIGTWIRNLETDSIETDEKTKELFGVALENFTVAESLQTVVHADDIASVTGAYEQAVNPAGNGAFNAEFRLVRPGGSVRWLQSTGQTFFEDEPKRAISMVGSTIDITDRKEAEKALSESEERYRAIFSQATAGVSEMDRDGNIVLSNDVFCQMLGYTKEEMLGMNFRDFTHPDYLAQCAANFEAVINNGQASSLEKKVIRSDESVIWIAESIASLLDENGNTNSVVTVGIDINERKKTEIFIHESEERYRIALEAGELATWDWNLKTDMVVWNEQHFRLFGAKYEEEAITPEYFLSFIQPEDISLVKQQLAEVLGPKGVYSAEFRIRRADNNKIRWMTGYGRVSEREGDRPTRVSGVMFDSTLRREVEENLEATKNSLNTALEAAKMGVWSMDMTHGFMDRSAKHDELLGYPEWQEEWNHNKAKQFITEEDKPKYDAAYANLLQNGIFNLEARVKSADGSVCWIHYFGRTFRNEDAKGETAAGVIFDITDQKTIEKQKDEFIGIASHELKTPVTSIKAYAEILQEMFEDAEDSKSAELMKKLDSQVDRLSRLIRDLLDVTKVSEGQLHLVTHPFNLETVIRNTAEEMQRTTRTHTINLSIPALPEIVGDEERISQVLVNMMSNAIKYSPNAREIFVTAKNADGKVSVSVQDFGIGMSAGTLEKLFARFFRSDNPSVRSFPGLGLGLFISMEIMKRHGGTIAVQSEKGKGSVFTMVLPLI